MAHVSVCGQEMLFTRGNFLLTETPNTRSVKSETTKLDVKQQGIKEDSRTVKENYSNAGVRRHSAS